MFQWKILLIAGVLVLTVLVVTGYGQVQNVSATCQFRPQSLIAASPADVEKAAVDYTCTSFQMFGGTPQVLLTRSITPAEAISLFGRTDILCQDQQLSLVILKGEFARKAGSLVDNAEHPHFEYLGYVFDLRIGAPTMVLGSHGEKFRAILNEPDLPADGPAETSKAGFEASVAPALSPLDQLRSCNYNSVEPTVVPPK